jgi:hypothetical protein
MYCAIHELDSVAAVHLLCHYSIYGGGGVVVLAKQLRDDYV